MLFKKYSSCKNTRGIFIRTYFFRDFPSPIIQVSQKHREIQDFYIYDDNCKDNLFLETLNHEYP
jgi:hypothetical protein